jgi:hypothetical protein
MPAATVPKGVIHHEPCHRDRQRRFVPGGRAQFPQFIKVVAGNIHMGSPGDRTQHAARGDAHGWSVGVTGG